MVSEIVAAPRAASAPAPVERGESSPAGAGRDLRIDLLRGFCVLAMVVDHIAGPSFLYGLTGGNRFYTSAAEAFIFISGLVMGLVYRRIIVRDGLATALRRAIERAMALYLLTITLTLLFIPAWELFATRRAQGVDFQDPAAFIVSVLTLHRTYYLVDIPLLYTLLILIAPLALALLSQGRGTLVLVASWTVWALYQFFPEQADMPWPIAGNYLFFAAAWQVFFFTGMVLGWHHTDLRERLANFPRRPVLLLSGLSFAALIVLYQLLDRLPRILPNDPEQAANIQLFFLEAVFGKSDVRPGRIIASIVVFGFFYLLVINAWRPIHRWLGWFLLPLGQSALYAYAAHVVLAVPVAVVLDTLTIPDRYARPLNAAAQIATLLAIWALIKGRVLVVSPSSGRARYIWPAAAVFACVLLLPLDPSPTLPGFASAAPEADPFASRVARAFGTPIPRSRAQPEATPVPLPRPNLRQIRSPLQRGTPPVSEYVGSIRGTFANMQFSSRALEQDMPYFIYLPPGYEEENRRYPVLYLLHGNSASYEEWVAYGLIDRADRMIASHEILPLIIVLPQGDYSYWINLVNGPPYGDYLTRDLVRHINTTYRVLPGREHRAIGGLSMGATGALIAAFSNPQEFSVVGAHSPSLPGEGERAFLGEGREYERRDPISLVDLASRLSDLWIWIDMGSEDDWLPRAELLDEALIRRGIDHEFRVMFGDHDDTYWSRMVPEYLRFYDAALNPERRP